MQARGKFALASRSPRPWLLGRDHSHGSHRLAGTSHRREPRRCGLSGITHPPFLAFEHVFQNPTIPDGDGRRRARLRCACCGQEAWAGALVRGEASFYRVHSNSTLKSHARAPSRDGGILEFRVCMQKMQANADGKYR